MSASTKRRRNGGSDNEASDNSEDEMQQFTESSFTQQRNLIFKKLLSIENENKKTIENLTDDIELLKSKVEQLEEENIKLKRELNYVHQSDLSDSIIIYGVPENKNIPDKTLIKNIGDQLNIPLIDQDLSDTYRIKPKAEDDEEDEKSSEEDIKCPPIVVKFTRKTLKSAFIKQRSKANLSAADIGIENCNNRVYINELLTKSNLELLRYAKELKKYDAKFVWCTSGKILVRDKKGLTIHVKDKAHADRLIKHRKDAEHRRRTLQH